MKPRKIRCERVKSIP